MRKMNATAGSFSLRDGSKALIRFAPAGSSVDLSAVRDRLSTARSAVLFAVGPRSRRSIVDDILELPKSIYLAGVAARPTTESRLRSIAAALHQSLPPPVRREDGPTKWRRLSERPPSDPG